MEANKIIQEGTLAKFVVSINAEGFDMNTMNFCVELTWGMIGEKKIITKDQMLEASGGYLFELDTTDIIGQVKARCIYDFLDVDVSGAIRPDVDDQWLCFVTSSPCPRLITCPQCPQDKKVTYTRVDESDVAEKYLRLVDSYDRPIMTVDNEYIYVLRSIMENE